MLSITEKLFFASFLIINQITFFIIPKNCLASDISGPYEVMPWRVGQFVVYQIVSTEGEGVDNRYVISLVGKEEIDGRAYFWIKIDIYESIISYSYNSVTKIREKNVSFKTLVQPKDSQVFISDPESFISAGIFPKQPLKLAIQFGCGKWHWIDPANLSTHQDVIGDTPYSITPHAKGENDYRKLRIDQAPQIIDTSAGKFLCYHFFINTEEEEEYYNEGLELWRSPDVPILGLVKMEFSKTLYWEKRAYQNKNRPKKTFLGLLKSLYTKRVTGRARPDTYIISLFDYGPKER